MADRLDPRVARSRAAIVQAAAELVRDAGAIGVTMEGVAERAGVAKTTLYRLFSTRAELLVAAFDHINPCVGESAGGSLHDFLHEHARNLVAKLEDQPWAKAVPALIDEAERSAEVDSIARDHAARRRAALVARFELAVAEGEIAPDIDPELAASRFLGPLFYRRFFTRQSTSPAEVETLVTAFLDGIRPGPTSASGSDEPVRSPH
ncbi:MAG: TetR/AcrR family transcriptional regulator [Ilumatobacteraceae bacterium]